MDRKNFRTFTTGEFAKRFGVKKDTLFYYDKIGLFKPAGISDNGYRYYTIPQFDIFWVIQSLRDLDFPLKSLDNYLKAPSPQDLIELSKNQLNKVDQEIEKLIQIRSILNRIVLQSEEALNAPLDKVILMDLEEEPILYSDKNTLKSDTTNEEWSSYYEEFFKKTELKGPAFIGSVIDKNDLLSGRFGRIDRLFVRMDKSGATIKPAGVYAVTYYKGSYESIVDFYEVFIRKIKEQGLIICGDAYEEYLLNVLATQNSRDFVTKISVAVK
ncbi:MerR family DNA-binding transcriptional regulator [Clostridium botulinum]|uniref:MerR family DNA-binding transcriptional regulator n=1 Tax=Clostridium botulinum TaxID=1491 RepID=A0A846J2A4_CLOBO|nr:MerR family DNA-binding transcriptional regulator [Clostridium botulinum]NFH64011.1 MerR family DNA-binding transcriptional regulator [Clostridium botulinum]NFJ07410.1 MerR family DNA-binding transcriptional regulator [Clostridium botulinum]NFK14382.1 MerR family DNA-binding transcriptional regulator [Clostridium botulinum]NFM92832.1 MerR family DNA-binding transcriptional regulator [Clostridium botulinum]NFO16158.1 MerR family DNA-binding transcriptional regulator [Clostridium botulinum]